MVELPGNVWSSRFANSEFWSAIGGALGGTIGGGAIAYLVQVKALREARRQREEDRRRAEQLLGNSLIVKMIKLYSDCHNVRQHLKSAFDKELEEDTAREPWQFVLPLANLPAPILFSSDEMSMLMAMKNDNVFNSVFPLDTVHNSLLEVATAFHTQRATLLERLPVDTVNGDLVGSNLSSSQLLTLRPHMILVNNIIEELRQFADRSASESHTALYGLHALLRDKLGISYKLESSFPTDYGPNLSGPGRPEHSTER